MSNQDWIDGINNNLLLTNNYGRADRILAYASGADDYPMYKGGDNKDPSLPPMANEELGISPDSRNKITAMHCLASMESKVVYFIMPHKEYFSNLDKIKNTDYEKEMTNALNEWKNLLNRGTKIEIEDKDLMSCYYACVTDLFVMREKGGKFSGITAGTRDYRSSSSGEAL